MSDGRTWVVHLVDGLGRSRYLTWHELPSPQITVPIVRTRLVAEAGCVVPCSSYVECEFQRTDERDEMGFPIYRQVGR